MRQLDGKQLPNAAVVPALCSGQFPGKEHTGTQLPTSAPALRERDSHSTSSLDRDQDVGAREMRLGAHLIRDLLKAEGSRGKDLRCLWVMAFRAR